MKLFICLPLAVLGASSSSLSNEFLAAVKGAPDGNGAMQQLSRVMSAAQQKLSLVERRYGKVVKKVRKQAESLLEEEAKSYGEGLSSYSSKILQADAELQSTVDVARVVVKAATEKAAANTHDWTDPEVMQRAEVNSQVAATDRLVKRGDHRRQSELREAREHSEETLESEGQKLGLKLGDMTPVVDKAKTALQARVEETSAQAAAIKVKALSAPKKATLASLKDLLTKAVSKERAVAADAKRNLDSFLSKADQDISIKRSKLQESLDAAQHDEIRKTLGPPPVEAKAAKAKAKAKPAKTVMAKAEVKVAPAVKPVAAQVVKAKPAVVKAEKPVVKLSQLKIKSGGIKDPCAGITCAANLKCPAGFAVTKVDGHCCPYCVNPNIKLAAAITGATGSNGGKASTFCPKVWCFPTSCTKALVNPTTTNGACCATCPA